MTSEQHKLCSVHYTPDVLQEVETSIQELADEVEFEYGLPRGGGLLTTDSAEKAVSNMISNEITTFYITAETDDGTLLISADGTGEDAEHQLTVDGEDRFRNASIRKINQVTKSHEASRIRSKFHSKYISTIQSLLIWSMVFWNIRYFWPVFGIPYYVSMPTYVVVITILGVLTVIGLGILDRLYPYVAIRRDHSPSQLYKFLAHIAMIASIIGLLLSAIVFTDTFVTSIRNPASLVLL